MDVKMGELTKFAAEQQRRFDDSTSPEDRKNQGHFGTPATIAEFMAGMFGQLPSGRVRILDPGAGVGMLSAAICQRALKQKTQRHLVIELWETDPRLIPFLERTMRYSQKSLRAAGHEMEFVVRVDDFILSNPKRTLFHEGPDASFHLAILNPPYFKLRKESPQARAMKHVVHGQPNIYSLFMAVCADLLASNGEMVAITPRSYFSGPYFKRFRKWFFDRMATRHIHIFESRSDAFRNDAVLQENVVLLAKKSDKRLAIVLTTSAGRDLSDVNCNSVPYATVVDDRSGDHVIRVTTNQFDHEVVATMDDLPNRFCDLGYEISTGPVVTFRSTQFLRDERSDDTAPLLWMHNVRPFVMRPSPKNGKPTHIEVTGASKKLLVPARTYVLLKRFTAKEEKRRLVAGIVNASDSYSEWVGLENHLNYVYRKDSDLAPSEAFGLAAFFNSAFVDRYFRVISGHTQVNATEIRGLPIPDKGTLTEIGEKIQQLETRNPASVERVVGQTLRLPGRLLNQLVEAAQ